MKDEKLHAGSLKSFFEWNYLKLKNYTRRRLGGPSFEADAEDILQDVALNLFARINLDSTVTNLAGYIYRSIRNRIADYRSEKKEAVSMAQFIDDEGNDMYMYIPDDAPVDAIIEGMEDEAPPDLDYALSLLPPEDRQLIIENEFNGRTFAELSKAWGISQGTLLSRKSRALRWLHELLSKKYE